MATSSASSLDYLNGLHDGDTGGQPPITSDSGVFSTDWLPGAEDGTRSPVVVSFTDFRATTDDELAEIFRTGLDLGNSWPIMSGAVGLWLWGKPSEMRGGSLSVWQSEKDLRRFYRWPVHAAIVTAWRRRIEVRSQRWEDASFAVDQAWLRAEWYMRLPRDKPAVVANAVSRLLTKDAAT